MLESGIGRAHNIALTTLSNFIMPGDTAASSRYWEKDLIEPEVTVEDGMIKVPERSGIGYEPNYETIREFTVFEKKFALGEQNEQAALIGGNSATQIK